MESPRRESDDGDVTSDEDMGIIKNGMEHIILADLGINEEDLEVESDTIVDDDVVDENNNVTENKNNFVAGKQVEVD